ncbi:MAG: PD-(D/E)XK nuclease family protein, partial [Candidatus Acinetobacter avistercoris]|nr:PD-(D/E)XK nuclease family protein [Candidatus Acinetobacter avistercoris]
MIELKLLKYVKNEIKANDIAKKRYANQLAPNFSVFNYIFTNELMLNKIISDLLSPQGDHGQQESFLNLFLKMLSNNSSYDQYDIQKSKIY